jgi:2'-5' RNA ligase
MRCFIAINLNESIRNEIASAIEGLSSWMWDVKWVPAENLHVTLRFLGEMSDTLADRIRGELAEIAKRHGCLDLSFRGAGVFPDMKRPRVIWIDLFHGPELNILKEEIDNSLVSCGIQRENRQFSPHLTIGRVRSLRGKEFLLEAVEALKDKDFGNIRADKVSLMKSDLKPAGAQYSVIAEFPLTRRNNDQ